MAEKPKKGEYLKKETSTKKTYFYHDEINSFDVKSREVFKTGRKEIHFPFSKQGKQKYTNIRSIEFREVSPEDVRGVFKNSSFGLGFTKILSPLIYELEPKSSINKVVISKKDSSGIKKGTITFNTRSLDKAYDIIQPFKLKQSADLKQIANNELSKMFGEKEFKPKPKKYIKDYLSSKVSSEGIIPEDLSDKDVQVLIDLIPKEIKEKKLIYKVEEKVNFIKLNSVKEEFSKLINQKTNSSQYEEKCQKFFEDNSWIFSSILSMPISLVHSKAYVGGKSVDNEGGKIADFLYSNNLTNNVFIIEIKTPLKKIVDFKSPYRGPNVFSMGKELTGGLIQVLDQRDNLQKEFHTLSKGKYQSFNPVAVLIIGKLSDLTTAQVNSFELFRNSLSGVQILTFDELLNRTELILKEFVDNN